MAIWVCRTGTKGEFEQLFFQNSCICFTRENYNFNLKEKDEKEIIKHIKLCNPDAALQTISNTWSQVNIFANRMCIGDVVIIPKKNSSIISIGIIKSDYIFDSENDFPLKHIRNIQFIKNDIDTCHFPQKLRYSMRAFRTIFSINCEEEMLTELQKEGVVLDEI